jgi:hypothetical protein
MPVQCLFALNRALMPFAGEGTGRGERATRDKAAQSTWPVPRMTEGEVTCVSRLRALLGRWVDVSSTS